jgi:hypothetical protein
MISTRALVQTTTSPLSLRRALAATALSASLLVVAACDGDDEGTGLGPRRYALRQVEGFDLPTPPLSASTPFGVVEVVFTGGVLELEPDGTFAATIDFQIDGEPTSFTPAGTYEESGSTITFNIDGQEVAGTISGDQIEIDYPIAELGESANLLFERDDGSGS